ncbi:zinc/iron-chelating domain-containing protein [Pseudomonas sp. LB-090624]|uniref:YkgJ family cysteine cluster protein n=1 Tax=Pseudomonas sp. LB-090624 TaxID=2213079 RepID=UPI000D8A55C4|nr:YkgJ family cysteine cluster protein [Pseudomonas sp. LB-090624]PYB73549.1 zinc/iron-chelating domain-containing protein [Pseudomonas sp. LB-090624]
MTDSLRFGCTGCGKCCTGHHVPLTLDEARRWAADAGQVIVLIEAFVTDGPGMPPEQREHVLRRSYPVRCGNGEARVSVTFAAFNPGRCRNLDDNDLCIIYEQRPLVCRIYPVEINPHIPLRPESKDCPPEAWQQGPELIHGTQLVDAGLKALVQASRQADREDIAAKVAVCQALGMTTSALKGNGFTAYLPDMGAFAAALAQRPGDDGTQWSLHVEDEALVASLQEQGLHTTHEPPVYYAFIGF